METSRKRSLLTRSRALSTRRMNSSERESTTKMLTGKELTRISTEETIRSKLGSFRSLTTKSKEAMVVSNLLTPAILITTTTALEELKRARESR